MAPSPRRFAHVACVFPVLILSFLLVSVPAPALAQSTTQSHWGVAASFSPEWEITESIRKLLFDEDEQGTIKGSEFSIGFVRGSTRGGDWGVSFVRKPWKDGSGPVRDGRQCFNQAQTICANEHESTFTKGVYLNGIEVHWFIAIVRIKNRAQVGVNVAGGIASVNGEVVTTTDGSRPVSFNQAGPILAPFHEVETLQARDELLSKFPLGKVEAEGSIIIVPALKAKIAGGFNFPGKGMRVGMVYLIGAR